MASPQVAEGIWGAESGPSKAIVGTGGREHDALEIYEGMARVFGNSDAVQVEFAKSSLETVGLHPLVFSRKASPISLGGPDYTLFKASGDYDGHVINEFKLMVPCQEVEFAIEKLRKHKFIV
jgi:hypothetical protein